MEQTIAAIAKLYQNGISKANATPEHLTHIQLLEQVRTRIPQAVAYFDLDYITLTRQAIKCLHR